MKRHALLLLTPIFSLSLLSMPPASGACPNGGCSKTSGTGNVSTYTYMKGTKVNAAVQTAITSVSGNSITVTESKAKKTYQTDASTRVLINGNLAGVERLQNGMHVTVDSSSLKPQLARTISATTIN